MSMSTVDIEYCVPCGYLDRALTLQRAILETFGQSVERAALVTGDGGVFRVSVDGERVWDVADDEYDVDEVVRRVRAAV